MVQVIYDFSALPELKGAIEELKAKYDVILEDQGRLAEQKIEALQGKMMISSDERFFDKTDAQILDHLTRFTETGLTILYIAGVRPDKELSDGLQQLGAETYFVEELTVTGVRDWLDEVLAKTTTQPSSDTHMPETTDSNASVRANADINITADFAGVTGKSSRAFVISGAAGAGTTFIALQIAKVLSEQESVQYVEAGLRPCLTTWLGAEENETDATLSEPLHPTVEDGNLYIYTRNPMGEEIVSLRSIIEALSDVEGTVIYDMGLQDYMASVKHEFAQITIRILVTTADLHRCRYLEGLPADIVVVNQAPSKLPIDESEFFHYWPDAKIFFMPYEPEQALAIVQGQPVVVQSEQVRTAVQRVKGEMMDAAHLAR